MGKFSQTKTLPGKFQVTAPKESTNKKRSSYKYKKFQPIGLSQNTNQQLNLYSNIQLNLFLQILLLFTNSSMWLTPLHKSHNMTNSTTTILIVVVDLQQFHSKTPIKSSIVGTKNFAWYRIQRCTRVAVKSLYCVF